MINPAIIFYGLTIGGILYITSIGLSLTYGMMHIINFAHGMFYTIGAYALFTFINSVYNNYILGILFTILIAIPITYVIERFIIRRLYGVSIDYAIIATYAIVFIGIDVLRTIYGATPIPLSAPINQLINILGAKLPLYRIVIIAVSFLVFIGLEVLFNKTLIGKIVVAGLDDSEAVKSLGINIDSYFSFVFVLGGCLAALGGAMYAPITSIEPYMGLSILQLSFAVVIIGGRGNIRNTFFSALAMGQVMAITGSFWGAASEVMVFLIMGVTLAIRGN